MICADRDLAKAEDLAKRVEGCVATEDWRRAVDRKDVSAVIVATTNDALPAITRSAIEAGKHVLVEKPAARDAAEISNLPGLARQHGVLVRVGFNHRYHRAFVQARRIVDSGDLGPLMFVRGRYGHGGRIGYEKEWRARPDLSGGGELIDQGVHLIDLARWFLGDFSDVSGYAHTYFWDMPVDDNALPALKDPRKASRVSSRQLHGMEEHIFASKSTGRKASCRSTAWAAATVSNGLPIYKMLPEMGPPETTIWEYPQADNSWEVEFAEFLDDIRLGREPSPGLTEAMAALRHRQENLPGIWI